MLSNTLHLVLVICLNVRIVCYEICESILSSRLCNRVSQMKQGVDERVAYRSLSNFPLHSHPCRLFGLQWVYTSYLHPLRPSSVVFCIWGSF